MVDDELEDAMPVRGAERNRIHARFSGYSWKGRADMRVEHGELELDVLDAGERLPGATTSVVLGNAGSEFLRESEVSYRDQA